MALSVGAEEVVHYNFPMYGSYLAGIVCTWMANGEWLRDNGMTRSSTVAQVSKLLL